MNTDSQNKEPTLLAQGWRIGRNHWAAILMAILFIALFYWLTSQQYLTFDTRASDLDRFSQGIWNTLQGRFLYSSIQSHSLLGDHFSPLLAGLSPLLLLWQDPRILTLAQTTGLAVAGIFLYLILYRTYPSLAPWFLLAFFLNPALHEVASLELRRIIPAAPFIAMALYGLASGNRWLMVAGLFVALLFKENVALLVAMIGLYLLLFERDWRWGLPLTLFGLAWGIAMMLWIIPALDTRPVEIGTGSDEYESIEYFSNWGGSLSEIARNVLTQPQAALEWMFNDDGRGGLLRVFLPLGFILPFLAPGIALIALPSMAYMLLSGHPTMHRLDEWYMASLLPVLFAAIAIGITKRPIKQARWLVGILLLFTLIGFRLYSEAPLGGRFNPVRYEITKHHRLAAEILDNVPDGASVAAQSAYTPRLAFRENLSLYPWLETEPEEVDYLVLDRYLKSYPLNEIERNDEINNIVADPNYIVEMEGDGAYLIRYRGEQLPAFPVNQTAEDAILLERLEVALLDDSGFYQNTTGEPIVVYPGQALRITLYWRAVAAPDAERTVSVRIEDESGELIAQHDMQPGNGARPTSWWQPGWEMRDVYYLTLSPGAKPGPASLDVLLYDSFTQERVPFDDGSEILQLVEMKVSESTPD
jgi:uncharacterized membrane protein